MSASLKKLDGLSHQLTVTVPAEELTKKYEQLLTKAAKNAKLPGFRPGKVPANILAQKFGKEIRQDAINELMQSSMQEAVQKQNLNIAGQPSLESLKAEEGKDLEYTIKFETFPEIKLADLSKASVERLTAEVGEKDIDGMLETLRKQNASWEKTDRAAKKDDRVVIDFDGSLNGTPFQGGKAEKFQLQLGSGQMIPGFEDGIMGMKAGEEKTIQVTFPAEYPAEELKGKTADFKITMHEVLEPKLAELDAEFAKKMGFKALDTMRDEVKKSMQQEIKNVLKQRLKMAVLDQLLEKNPIQVPAALMKQEVSQLQQTTRQRMIEQYGKEAGNIEQHAAIGLSALLPAEKAVRENKPSDLLHALNELEVSLTRMQKTMDRMPENCDPYIYYNRVRPYIHGWKDNPALPQGLIYEGVEEFGGKPQQFKGETGAQSGIIPLFDAALKVEHADTPLKQHLDQMRKYMPPEHQEFLDELEAAPSIRDYIKQQNFDELKQVYNRCIELIAGFRTTHLKYAAQYIEKQNQTSEANSTVVGTGGTPFMAYLKKHRDETQAFLL